jgi:hypothetical protein
MIFDALGLALSQMILTGCEKDETKWKSEFKIEFSDGTLLAENNISCYDSSTHLVFLKKDFELNQSVSDFHVVINNDTVFNGVIHSCVLSSPPPLPHYIMDCFLHGNNIKATFSGKYFRLKSADTGGENGSENPFLLPESCSE